MDRRSPDSVSKWRWWIGGLLFASTVINYIDRQTVNVLGPYLKTEYHWNNQDFALVVVAFRAAYALGPTFAGRSRVPAGETFSRAPVTGPQLPSIPGNN